MQKPVNETILKAFMYDSKLKDYNVYSRQYLNSILFSKYKDNKTLDNNYTLIYGDFNKLHSINATHGDASGDVAIKTAINIIKDNLPSNCQIARIGGDEFVFIIENSSKADIDNNLLKIEELLKSKRNAPYNLTMTFSSIYSKDHKNIKEMYEKVENNVSAKKNQEEASILLNKSKEDIITTTMEKSFSNYLSFFRFPPDFIMKPEYFSQILMMSVTAATDLIEKKNLNIESSSFHPNFAKILEQSEAREIDKVLHEENSKSELNNFKMNYLVNCMLREPTSQQLSRSYYEKYLKNNDDFHKKANAIYFTTTFLKLSNSLSGHIKTDEEIVKIAISLKKELSNSKKFKSLPFDNNLDNVFLDIGGANFLAIFSKDCKISNKKLQNIINKVNSNTSILKVSAYKSKKLINTKNINKFIQEANVGCKNQKNNLKIRMLKEENAGVALEIALEDSIKIYEKYNGNLNTMERKEAFINKLSQVMLDVAVRTFPTKDNKPKKITSKETSLIVYKENLFKRLFSRFSKSKNNLTQVYEYPEIESKKTKNKISNWELNNFQLDFLNSEHLNLLKKIKEKSKDISRNNIER